MNFSSSKSAAFKARFSSGRWQILLLLLLLAGGAMPAMAQTNIEQFGHNRVQTRTYAWRFFDTEHFRVYHYDRAGRTLARYVAEQAEQDISLVEQKLSGSFPKRFNIILYNQYDEYRQSNVGLQQDAQIEADAAGTVNLVGDKLVVYFTGVHTDLRRQLRAGMSRVVMQRLIFGEDFRAMVKNAVRLNIPQWVTDGFLDYLVDGWDAQTDAKWRALLARPPVKNQFYGLAEEAPLAAGKAFWKWVADTKGVTQNKEALNIIQSAGSMSKGIRAFLGMKEKVAYDSCLTYFRNIYTTDSVLRNPVPTERLLVHIQRPTDGSELRDIRVSPNGKDVAFITWKEGISKVNLQHTTGPQTVSVILQEGRRDYAEKTTDPDYPLLAWSNDGFKLAILYQQKTLFRLRQGYITRLRIYDALKGKIINKIIPPNRFDRVLGMTFVEDDTRMVFSAIKKSQTDLYDFTIRGSRLTNITNDIWDDVQPWYVSGGFRKGLLFVSNRPQPNMNVPAGVNELPTGPQNVFFYNTVSERPELIQCSKNEGQGTVSYPIQYGSDNFAYLYDSSGIRNQYMVLFGRTAVGNLDSAYSVPVTNSPQSLLAQQFTPFNDKIAYAIEDSSGYSVYQSEKDVPPIYAPITPVPTTYLAQREAEHRAVLAYRPRNKTVRAGGEKSSDKKERGRRKKPSKNVYQSEFSDAAGEVPASVDSTQAEADNDPLFAEASPDADTSLVLNPKVTDSTYLKLKSQPYRLSFKTDFFSLRADNAVLFTRYQSAAAGGGRFNNPPLSGLITASLNDALENHRFTGGLRIPTSFQGGTYFLQYQNFTNRIDWGLVGFLSNNFQNYRVQYVDPAGRPLAERIQLGKISTYLLQGNANLPFDRVRRLGLQLGLRRDVLDFKAQDTLSLAFSPRDKTDWLMSRLEYVFDNTTQSAVNIRQGMRYKLFAEGIGGISKGKGGMYNFGFDVRHYQKIYRNFTLATLFTGAHSGGKQKVLYFLGGVDNWILPKQAVGTGIADQNYAFQALATNLRGYKQNARNGNSYAVLNEELRLPIWNTLVRRPVRSPILNNLQLIGFVDAGAAWNGLFPDGQNTSTPTTIGNFGNPVLLNLEPSNKSDVGVGFGGGLRTVLLGYFVRLDAAWNIEGIRKPIWYFSFGTDF